MVTVEKLLKVERIETKKNLHSFRMKASVKSECVQLETILTGSFDISSTYLLNCQTSLVAAGWSFRIFPSYHSIDSGGQVKFSQQCTGQQEKIKDTSQVVGTW